MDRDEKIARLEAWSKELKERQSQRSIAEIFRENLTSEIRDQEAVLAMLQKLRIESLLEDEGRLQSYLQESEKVVEQLGAEKVIERLGIFRG